MSSNEDNAVVSIERHRIYEREKELIRELVEIRRSAARWQQSRTEQGSTEERASPRAATRESSGNKKRDRFGKEIKVGDKVEFLTPGKLIGKIWTVYKITDKRVLCERHNGMHKTHREFKNVRILD